MTLPIKPLCLSAGLLCTALPGIAAPVTEASVHFSTPYPNLSGFAQEIESQTGVVSNTFSSASQPGANPTQGIVGEARASINSLGVRLTTEFSGGRVAATIFEGVRFASSALPTTGNTLTGYAIGVIGTLTATLNQDTLSLSPLGRGPALAAGDQMLGGSRVNLDFFSTLDDRSAAVNGSAVPGATQRLASVTSVGTHALAFTVPVPNPNPPTNYVQPYGIAGPSSGPPSRVRPATSPCGPGVGLCAVVDPLPTYVTSFGLGLSLSAILQDEIGAYGEIDAFNSFDLEGLVMFDPDGTPLDGVFRSDSGLDLTLDAFRDDNIVLLDAPTSPIPLPAGALLLPAALTALGLMRRHRRPVAG